ncbi:hypothetical protein D3C76_1393600 [compost metagenome]
MRLSDDTPKSLPANCFSPDLPEIEQQEIEVLLEGTSIRFFANLLAFTLVDLGDQGCLVTPPPVDCRFARASATGHRLDAQPRVTALLEGFYGRNNDRFVRVRAPQ